MIKVQDGSICATAAIISTPEEYRLRMKAMKKSARKMGWEKPKMKLVAVHLKEDVGGFMEANEGWMSNIETLVWLYNIEAIIDGCIALKDGAPVYFTNASHMVAFIERFMK